MKNNVRINIKMHYDTMIVFFRRQHNLNTVYIK